MDALKWTHVTVLSGATMVLLSFAVILIRTFIVNRSATLSGVLLDITLIGGALLVTVGLLALLWLTVLSGVAG
jgi:hypothetical protein